MQLLKRRWVVRVKNPSGQWVSEKRFVRKATAKRYQQWMEACAVSGHKWQAHIPPDAAPIWTTEIWKDRS